jgi:hypothetical protein
MLHGIGCYLVTNIWENVWVPMSNVRQSILLGMSDTWWWQPHVIPNIHNQPLMYATQHPRWAKPQLHYGWSLITCILLYLLVQMMDQHVTTNHKFRYKCLLSILLSSVLQYHAFWYPPVRQHGAIKWKTTISMFEALNTSNTINSQ